MEYRKITIESGQHLTVKLFSGHHTQEFIVQVDDEGVFILTPCGAYLHMNGQFNEEPVSNQKKYVKALESISYE